MMKFKLLVGVCVFFVSGAAIAECPDHLNAEKTVECLTIEGSGANYQDWLAKFNTTETEMVVASTISPITGSDVRNIKPASGQN